MSQVDEQTVAGSALEGEHHVDHKERDLEGGHAPSLDTLSVESQPAGVSRIEAFYKVYNSRTKVWAFWIAFVIWAFAMALSADTTYVYLAFATSYFDSNSVLATIALLTSIMSGVINPFWAKLADFTVRPWCLAISLLFYTVGYAASAGANTVSTLAAGQVLYTIGNAGINFLQTLIVADLTSLQWRGVVNGALSLTYIPFAFVAADITSGIGLSNWRWGYGMFCILMPACLLPILYALFWADIKAKKLHVIDEKHASVARDLELKGVDRSLGGRILHVLVLIDALGLLLLGFSFAMFLSPPTLVYNATGGWTNPSMIAMMTVGGVLFILFCVWEWRFAKHPIMPKRILNRTFVMCLIIDFMYYLVGYLTDTYWASWVYVVQNYSDKNYTYMNEIETVTLCAFGIVAGYIQRYTHRYKYLQVTGLALRCLGSGINYWSSTGHTNTATLFFAKFILCLGGSFSVIGSQVASQGSVKHKDVAIAIAILSLWTSIGGAIGQAVSGSIWSNRLPAQLAIYAPSLNATEIALVASDITTARISEPRDGIIKAYNATYQHLSLIALILIFIPLVASLFTRNFVLDDRQNAVEDTIVEPKILASENAPSEQEEQERRH